MRGFHRHLQNLLASLLAATLLALAGPAMADDGLSAGIPRALGSTDTLLAKIFQGIRDSRLDDALGEVERLITLRPDFKLAHLIKGDLLLARARPLTQMGAAPAASQQSLSDLRDEARVRLMRYVNQPDPDLLPKQILQLSSDQKYALLADASRARLYLFENVNGEPRLIRDYYMTIGRNGTDKRVEGDKKTPMGLYHISQRLTPRDLTNFYGAGAFPLTYPNEWDQMQRRGGHGIWLHGVPFDTYSRPPRSSDGCVVVTNPDLTEISQYVQVGVTPVLIADRTEWISRDDWQALRGRLQEQLGAWGRDWESRDADRFLAHYAPEFHQANGNGWAVSKRRNIVTKDWIKVGLSDLSLFLYPDGDMAVATFAQDYASNSFTNATLKRQYLRQESGDWRIVLERTMDLPARYAQR